MINRLVANDDDDSDDDDDDDDQVRMFVTARG